MKGRSHATDFFMTRALLTTCGRNILPEPNKIPHHAHAGHQRPFDDGQRAPDFQPRLLGVGIDEINNALDQRVFEALLDGALAPFVLDDLGLVLLFDGLGKLDEAFRGVGAAIEQNVLDQFEQVLGNLLVNAEHAGVDDAHVQPGLDGVIQKGGVHRLAHDVVAAKGKGNVADAAADFGAAEGFA